MKIAMVTTSGERCGIASYSAALVESLRGLPDTEVEIVPIVTGEQEREHYEEQAKRLNESGVDLVHVQHEFSFWGFPMPGRSRYAELRSLIRRPVVVTAHTTLRLSAIFPLRSERNPVRWLRKKRLLGNEAYRRSVEVDTFTAEATIVHNDAAYDDFVMRGLDPARLFVIPAGVPAPAPVSDGARRFRKQYGLNGERLLTLFGYVTPNKGYELVAEALRDLPDDVTLVIAGGARRPPEQEYVDHLRRHLREVGVEDRTIVTGYLDDDEVAAAMEATDIALVPHTQATNSYSVALPLSHGRTTIASDLPCFREMAERTDCLELFRAGDVDDFRRKLQALLSDADRRAQLAANARRHAERFSWPAIAAATRAVYETALAARS